MENIQRKCISRKIQKKVYFFHNNLVDEAVLYLLPLSYGGGIPLTGEFRSARWKLLGSKTFSNGICRLMYKRNG